MNRRPKRRSDILDRRVDGEMVVLDRRKQKLHQLNATASYIWECCDGDRSVAEIVDNLVASFDVDRETVTTHVLTSIAKLAQLELLENPEALSSESAP